MTGVADLLNLPNRASGFIVKTVAKDSPGDQIGLRGSTMLVPIAGQEVPLGGDIIMTVNGISAAAANLAKIRDSMGTLPPGGTVQGLDPARGADSGADRQGAVSAERGDRARRLSSAGCGTARR